MSARDPTIAARSKRYRDRKRSAAMPAGRSLPGRHRSAATATEKPAQNSGETADGDPIPATLATVVAPPRSEQPATVTAATGPTLTATVAAMGPVARTPWTLGAGLLTIIALLIGGLALA